MAFRRPLEGTLFIIHENKRYVVSFHLVVFYRFHQNAVISRGTSCTCCLRITILLLSIANHTVTSLSGGQWNRILLSIASFHAEEVGDRSSSLRSFNNLPGNKISRVNCRISLFYREMRPMKSSANGMIEKHTNRIIKFGRYNMRIYTSLAYLSFYERHNFSTALKYRAD